MGATATVDVVDQGLNNQQRAELVKILQTRKAELQKAMDDVDTAIKKLKAKQTP
jgi:hypothetical protein